MSLILPHTPLLALQLHEARFVEGSFQKASIAYLSPLISAHECACRYPDPGHPIHNAIDKAN